MVYTVYSVKGQASFGSPEAAYDWAVEQHGVTGLTYECRDANFDHVFTVEA